MPADPENRSERRAPVQSDTERRPAGSISSAEHVEVFQAYAARYGRGQSAERIAERGGFGWAEARGLLGRELTTWEPR